MKKFLLFFTLFSGAVFLFFLFMFVKKNKEKAKTTSLLRPLHGYILSSVSPKKSALDKEREEKQNQLINNINAVLYQEDGFFAIYIKNLKTEEEFFLNSDEKIETASLYKLWVMAEVFSQIEQEKLKPDQILSQDLKVLKTKFKIEDEDNQDNENVDKESQEEKVTFSVLDGVTQMITISDNNAALLLTERIGLISLSNFLKQNGFLNSSIGGNKGLPSSTAKDIALFFELLINGKLANEENTKQMIEILASQRLNDGLPKYLPEGAKIAHKTGELFGLKHDAGIVFLDDAGDEKYVIVVLSNTENPLEAQEKIAKISKSTYDYFSR